MEDLGWNMEALMACCRSHALNPQPIMGSDLTQGRWSVFWMSMEYVPSARRHLISVERVVCLPGQGQRRGARISRDRGRASVSNFPNR